MYENHYSVCFTSTRRLAKRVIMSQTPWSWRVPELKATSRQIIRKSAYITREILKNKEHLILKKALKKLISNDIMRRKHLVLKSPLTSTVDRS
jgi:hypothetical protein